MNPETQLISLNLQNISNVDSEVNLLSYGNGISNVSTYYKIPFTFVSGVQYQLLSTIGGVFNNYFTAPVILTINDLINDFNTGGLAPYAFFSYELNGSAPNYNLFIKILDSTFIPTTFRSLTPTVSYSVGLPYQVPFNSTVSITTGTSITYQELLSELSYQPYKVNTINVYAETQEQAMQRLKKVKRTTFGVTETDFDRPRIDPMQQQYAIEHINTEFTPSPINTLNYVVNGGEYVRMWLYYSRIEQLKLKSKDSENLQNVNILKSKLIIPNKMLKIKESINPLFDLVGTYVHKKENIKDSIAKTIEKREITDEEVYNSFDSLDFNEF